MEVINWKISPNKLENPFKARDGSFMHSRSVTGSEEWHLTNMLQIACSNGDLALLRQVLDDSVHRNIDVNHTELYDGPSPLHRLALLVGTGSTETAIVMAKLLINTGADLKIRSHLGYTPIRNAVYSRNLELVKLFLSYDAGSINDLDFYGNSLLYVACLQSNQDMVALLLQRGADIDQSDFKGGRAPLHIACSVGSRSIVSTLIKNTKCKVNTKTYPEGWTPLYWSVYIGHLEIVTMLLESGKIDVDIKSDDERCTPLYCCVSNTTRTDILQKLFDYGANIDSKNGTDEWTCLQKASFMGKKTMVTWLCDHGASVEPIDRNGHSALTIACEKNHLDIVDLLLSCGANADTIHPSTTCTLLWDAVVFENYELASVLLKYDADIHCTMKNGDQIEADGKEDISSMSLMHYACTSQNLNIVKFLLSEGYDLEQRFGDGDSLLHVMSAAGYVEGIQALIAAGIPVGIENDMKDTPLHVACRYDKAEAAKVLILSDSTSLGHFNKFGHSPLHVTILSTTSIEILISLHETGANFSELTADGSTNCHLLCRNIELSKTLLSSDSKDAIILKEFLLPNVSSHIPIHSKNKMGKTPLHIACAVGNFEVICYLQAFPLASRELTCSSTS